MEGIEQRVSTLEKGHEVNCEKINNIHELLDAHEKRINANDKKIDSKVGKAFMATVTGLVVIPLLTWILLTVIQIKIDVAIITKTLSNAQISYEN